MSVWRAVAYSVGGSSQHCGNFSLLCLSLGNPAISSFRKQQQLKQLARVGSGDFAKAVARERDSESLRRLGANVTSLSEVHCIAIVETWSSISRKAARISILNNCEIWREFWFDQNRQENVICSKNHFRHVFRSPLRNDSEADAHSHHRRVRPCFQGSSCIFCLPGATDALTWKHITIRHRD
jgi:hypothetical protein